MLCSFSNPKNARKERCFFSLVSFVLNCDFHLPLFSSGMMILKNKKYLSFCPGGKSIPNPIDHRAQKEPFHLSTTRETKRDPPPVSPATTSSKKRWAKPSGVSLALSLFPRGARVWGIGDAGVFIIIIIIIIIIIGAHDSDRIGSQNVMTSRRCTFPRNKTATTMCVARY